jgi:Spy/CpxP family protein refolding chaperone
MNRIVKTLLLAAALAAAPAGAVAAPVATQAEPRPEQFYHIFVRSFADSDGDRNGERQHHGDADDRHRLDDERQKAAQQTRPGRSGFAGRRGGHGVGR